MLERTVRVGILFDFYGELLTNRQQEMVQLYFYQDLSLGEVADSCEISRQAVYDNLQRAEKALEDYEEKLGLVDRYKYIQQQIDDLTEIVDQIGEEVDSKKVEKLQRIIANLSD
ncbi:putative DNA-binding protein YlxM (UPF0122 family) [Sporohalobacter salinus]|nr:YlxM family DNA-binding protein [Sporohalobacter salinus]MBM7623548.1 putative DNA-binding protein YlxM (UPF0122 family) [Sporohalobacter salinus]